MSAKKEAHARGLEAAGSGLAGAYMAEGKHSTDELLRNIGRVERFFADNPSLLDELDALAEQHIASGRKFAIQEVVERWRWYRPVVSDGADLRINNSWCPIMSRLLVERHPQAAELIEMRASVYDDIFAGRASRATV